MSNLIKKSLFVLSLLIIPCMNAGVMAMDDHEYSEMHSRYYMGIKEEQEPATRSTYSSTVSLNAYKGLLIGTFILSCFVDPVGAACYCTCAGYPAKEGCKIFQVSSNTACRLWCEQEGFYKGYICTD